MATARTRRIIDAHHHLGAEDGYADRLAETCGKLGIVKVCLVCVNVAGQGAEDDDEDDYESTPAPRGPYSP